MDKISLAKATANVKNKRDEKKLCVETGDQTADTRYTYTTREFEEKKPKSDWDSENCVYACVCVVFFFYEFMNMFAGVSVNVLEAEHKFTIFVWGASLKR